jgi:hypothetical protein
MLKNSSTQNGSAESPRNVVFLVLQGTNPKLPSIRKISKIVAACPTEEAARQIIASHPRTKNMWKQKMSLTGE